MLYKTPESAEEAMASCVGGNRGDELKPITKKIAEFKGEYRFLSNFYPAPVWWWGGAQKIQRYPTLEHAYQASKCANALDRDTFTVGSASDAKRRGQKVSLISFWEEIKVDTMRQLLVNKFKSHMIRRMLLATGNAILEEGNNWGDKFWGVDLKTGKGHNMLGRLLMAVRDLYRIEFDGQQKLW